KAVVERRADVEDHEHAAIDTDGGDRPRIGVLRCGGHQCRRADERQDRSDKMRDAIEPFTAYHYGRVARHQQHVSARNSAKCKSQACAGAAIEMNIRSDPSRAFRVELRVPPPAPNLNARQRAEASGAVAEALIRWLRPEREAWSDSCPGEFEFDAGKGAFVISVQVKDHECTVVAVAQKRIDVDRIAERRQRM